MIIVGAKGLATELLQIISIDLKINTKDIVFFDNVSKDLPDLIYDKFKILKSFEEVEKYVSESKDYRFVLGLGNPELRFNLYEKFIVLGLNFFTIKSSNAEIGSFNVKIEEGCSVLSGAIISNSVFIGKGCLIYYNSVITHDCSLGDFVQVSPNVTISGRCKIGSFTSIGVNASILPDVTIGKSVVIGAGAVVLNDVPDNSVIIGVPGKILKR